MAALITHTPKQYGENAHPEYTWSSNQGYPTKAHRDAIRLHGATVYHRRSFRLLPDVEQGSLF